MFPASVAHERPPPRPPFPLRGRPISRPAPANLPGHPPLGAALGRGRQANARRPAPPFLSPLPRGLLSGRGFRRGRGPASCARQSQLQPIQSLPHGILLSLRVPERPLGIFTSLRGRPRM